MLRSKVKYKYKERKKRKEEVQNVFERKKQREGKVKRDREERKRYKVCLRERDGKMSIKETLLTVKCKRKQNLKQNAKIH